MPLVTWQRVSTATTRERRRHAPIELVDEDRAEGFLAVLDTGGLDLVHDTV